MNNNNNPNPFISAFPPHLPQQRPSAPSYAYMFQRIKTQEELDREREDAEFARSLFMDEGKVGPAKTLKEDEEFAKKLIFDESLKTKEQTMLQLLQDEAAAVRFQKEEEGLEAIRKRNEENERKDAEEARRLQEEEEYILRRRRESEEISRRDAETVRRLQAEEEEARRRKVQQVADEELALKFQRDEERRIQEQKDQAVARRFQEEDAREAEAERRRIAEEDRRRREQERESARKAEEERRRIDQIVADAELARHLERQLHIYIPPPPPPVPIPYRGNYVNQHTLAIHTQHCGCNKHNSWNSNHITNIHRKYCNCNHPHYGQYTNQGLFHEHGVGCRFYCKYQNHVHTHECCQVSHMHSARCHCAAKFC